MASYKEKKLTYRRAIWIVDGPAPDTLEGLIRQSMAKLKTAAERQIPTGAGHLLSCVDYEPIRGKGVFIHLSATTPGEQASIVKTGNAARTDKIELEVFDAPRDSEWLDGDSFIFVVENHVCICALQIRDSTIRQYIFQIIGKAMRGMTKSPFHIKQIANSDKLTMIHEIGVKEIQLNSYLYEASANAINNQGRTRGVTGILAKHLGATIGSANNVTNDGIHVEVVLKLDGRLKKHVGLGGRKLEAWASDLITNPSDDDDYVIVLANDAKIFLLRN